jgi:hypothetical protein
VPIRSSISSGLFCTEQASRFESKPKDGTTECRLESPSQYVHQRLRHGMALSVMSAPVKNEAILAGFGRGQ